MAHNEMKTEPYQTLQEKVMPEAADYIKSLLKTDETKSKPELVWAIVKLIQPFGRFEPLKSVEEIERELKQPPKVEENPCLKKRIRPDVEDFIRAFFKTDVSKSNHEMVCAMAELINAL
ncbi:hypothetical protein RyT2_14190 [Pseudolactococcus yaeyamensis]